MGALHPHLPPHQLRQKHIPQRGERFNRFDRAASLHGFELYCVHGGVKVVASQSLAMTAELVGRASPDPRPEVPELFVELFEGGGFGGVVISY